MNVWSLLARRSVMARRMRASEVENEMDRGGVLAAAFMSSLAASLGPGDPGEDGGAFLAVYVPTDTLGVIRTTLDSF